MVGDRIDGGEPDALYQFQGGGVLSKTWFEIYHAAYDPPTSFLACKIVSFRRRYSFDRYDRDLSFTKHTSWCGLVSNKAEPLRKYETQVVELHAAFNMCLPRGYVHKHPITGTHSNGIYDRPRELWGLTRNTPEKYQEQSDTNKGPNYLNT
ncbi:hypothetical protein BDD12DRAFT_158216 [Trichophaea hybrida]|nr:hypothetical protein BDD12DRAFT_158216 [Trichophaea hybrida]